MAFNLNGNFDFSKDLKYFPSGISIENAALYVHIPFCLKKCEYCDFYSIVCNQNPQIIPDDYIDFLISEASELKKYFKTKSFPSIYIGGGTPSLLSEVQIQKLLSALISFSEMPPKEITIEANPQDLNESWLETVQNAGVNRLSLGMQTFSDICFSKIGRRGSRKENLSALELINKVWKGRLSCDIISGLPSLTEDDFYDELKILTSHPKVDHISMYSLCVEEGTPLFEKIEKGIIDFDFDFSDEMWIKGRDFLEKHNFFQYEVSNFSKRGFESVHNMSYWKQENYFGLGSGGCSTIYYKNKNNDFSGWRFTGKKFSDFNNSSTDLYFETENLNSEQCEFEFLMMGFRTLQGIDKNIFESRFGKNLQNRINNKSFEKGLLDRMISEGNIAISENNIGLTKKGILFLNDFLERL